MKEPLSSKWTRMRRRVPLTAVLALVIGATLTTADATTAVRYDAMQSYEGPYFGANNFPPGCTRDPARTNPENNCFRMVDISSLNPLDSPQIDVLILVPVSATVERDMRTMRQVVEMWEGGIQSLAGQMGLEWLAEGVDFHITIDAVDATGDEGGEFTTYPVVDPEIVLVLANPAAGVGAGISPAQAPCLPLANPFDVAAWEALPGFDSHHDSRSGTYVENCDGSGGNICVAVLTGWDPEPGTVEWWSTFNMVSHEVGHCLSLGHIGDTPDALGNGWGAVTSHDIMSYSDDLRITADTQEPGVATKCVSTLDVELFATRMSRYLDVNGDGAVTPADQLAPNEPAAGFQVQHPADNLYASSTGSPSDCPKPDLGLLPGPRTDWSPDLVPSVEPVLDLTSPRGDTTSSSDLVVAGNVYERSVHEPAEPPPTSVTYEDSGADATGAFTEIQGVTLTANDTHVEAVVQLGQIWPSTDGISPVSYSLTIDDKRFDSFVNTHPLQEGNPKTYHELGYMPPGTSEWDLQKNQVLFHIPREFLRGWGISAPYQVSVTANHGQTAVSRDDWAPEPGQSRWLGAPPQRLPQPVENPSNDDDQDGVPDTSDRCPAQPGLTAEGCTARTATQIQVFIDGKLAGSQDVYADYGPADFAIPVTLRKRRQTIRVEWLDDGRLLASRELTAIRHK